MGDLIHDQTAFSSPMRAPWRLKMAAKLMLSRLPVQYETWRRISFFRHGAMDDADYAIAVFDRHFANAGPAGRPGFVAFELGPGDSVASALIARAFGASETYLVDVGPFAKRDIGPYLALADKLRDRGLDPIPVRYDDTIEDLPARCGGRYLTDGMYSLPARDSSCIGRFRLVSRGTGTCRA